MKALISVSDKSGIVEFAQNLVAVGYEIISTGGTAQTLAKAEIPHQELSAYTGFPEMLDGRVKTLHPKIHGGLLALHENPEHQATVKKHNIEWIDLVVVNLYPFEACIQKPNLHLEEAIENIDIGGPSMLRSAAKNHSHVTVICDPTDYAEIAAEIKENHGKTSLGTRQKLAVKVFEHTAAYDAKIGEFLREKYEPGSLPTKFNLSFSQKSSLRYGENPHQKAAYYGKPFTQIQGKELSFNNIYDLDSAWALIQEFEETACAIIKHNNPCGVALDPVLSVAYEKALQADPISAFGGILVVNRKLDLLSAQKMSQLFLELIAAPSFEPEALELLKSKKNLRLIQMETKPSSGWDIKRTGQGVLVQERNMAFAQEFKQVTDKAATKMSDLIFALKICKHVKSNAIVLVKDQMSVGIGAGQTSRIDSLKIALDKAKSLKMNQGAVLASDAFFPFRDCVDLAAENGILELIQPGGSMRDQESVDAANQHGLAMVFTGIRHFKH